MRYILIFLISLLSFSSVLMALEQPLKDVYQEQRAKEIFKSLKCAVCAGQSVQDSDSEFAKSVRSFVRENISRGLNNEQVYDILRNNYGAQIMFKPPFDGKTALLWLAPFILILIGFLVVISVLKRNKAQADN